MEVNELRGSKEFETEFLNIDSGEGVVDIAIRYDTNTGDYNYCIEESGIPATLPVHVFMGILEAVKRTRE
jgi:hypothetical protein